MNTADWARLKEWFGEALDSPERIPELLQQALRESPALAQQLQSLLVAHESPGLETSSVLSAAMARAPLARDAEHDIPDAIGPYRTLRELGRGGTGLVLLAERTDDEFHRPVALKVLRWVSWDRRSLDLLTQERGVLAQLQHPNIASLVDWGTTPDGTPWLATEYVEGQPIDDYCRSRRLDVPATLRVFRQVCEAAQYAHRRLLVHRDLKPANILVTAAGLVKLLDFGISKALKPLEEEPHTQTIDRRFTPAYASPEQIQGKRVTAAADVYALGLLLYELLAGALPFDPAKMEDVLRRLDDRALPPPSARPGLSRDRQRAIRGDLDRITLHALERDPERRYQSVEQLIADLDRYEGGYPISVRPPNPAYLAWLFARRHAAAVALAALAVVALVTGTTVAIWNARVARNEQRIAEQRFGDLRDLARAVMFDLHDGVRQLPGSTDVRRQLITIAVRYLDAMGAERIHDDRLQFEVAAGYARMGYAQGGLMGVNLGDTPGARRSYGAALRIADDLWTRQPDDEPIGGLRFAVAYNLSLMSTDPAEGVALATRYADEAEAWARRRQSAPPLQAIQLTRNAAGRTLRWTGAYDEALRQFAASENALRRMLPLGEVDRPTLMFGVVPMRTQMYFDLGQTFFARTETLLDLNRLEEALAAVEHARAWFDRSDNEGRKREASNLRMFARVHGLKAEVLRRLTRLDEAAAAAAIEMSAATRNASDGNATAQRDLAEAYRHQGSILIASGRHAAGIEQLRLAVETIDRLAAGDPTFAVNQYLLSGMLNDYGEALARRGLRADAERVLRRVLEVVQGAATRAPSAIALENERVRAELALKGLSVPGQLTPRP